MCGICGFFSNSNLDFALLTGMTDTIIHRGPDDDGFYMNGKVGLGMRRLSIIDVMGGKQPIFNESRQIVVVLNGEIYNYLDLKNELIKRGHVFQTKSDTEVIVHLYEQYGLGFVDHLRGMFAIALYDHDQHRLVLVRDRMGKKPLYYAHCQQGFIFGSEIKPILFAAPELRCVSERMLYVFFRFGFVPEPQTIYSDIYQLPAGSLLVFDGTEPIISRYWDVKFANADQRVHPHRMSEYVDELDALLEEAVRIRLMSEVPLGAFLSGGPDSSLIVAYMSRLQNRPVKTFTVAFDETDFDESQDALRVAKHCGTEHHVRLLNLQEMQGDFFSVIDTIVSHTDQPFGDSSALPTFYISRLAREELTVILGGDGADEAFCGYNHYQALRFARIYQSLPESFRLNLVAPLVERWVNLSAPGPRRWRAKAWQNRLADSNLPLASMLANKYAITNIETLCQLTPQLFSLFTASERSCANLIPFGDSSSFFEKSQYADLMFHQLNDMLVKVDRMSMANSLEARHPYLDHKVVEFAAKLPMGVKLGLFETKSILRAVATRYLPYQNAYKKKQGFSVPMSLWLRTELWDETRDRLISSSAVNQYFKKDYIEVILKQHRLGLVDHSELIWCLLVFVAWHRIYMER